MKVRRLALAVAASVAAVTVVPTVAHADEVPPRALPVPQPDVLTITSGGGAAAPYVTYELSCEADGSGGGSHPRADEACARLAAVGGEGRDPFAAVPADALCTQQYGGPETARITGTWHGRQVSAEFDRSDGCEIGRWQQLVPVLPEAAGSTHAW
ncbi:SSI family serine proteinase inhibitor [Streptomyces sp. NPDC050418]|uniref:SSI family serine proteinase inhibitor n=1 Tax=Streptomyces sp. NPDC050418 TaxID=3365612 RepID=UPI0037AC6BDE